MRIDGSHFQMRIESKGHTREFTSIAAMRALYSPERGSISVFGFVLFSFLYEFLWLHGLGTSSAPYCPTGARRRGALGRVALYSRFRFLPEEPIIYAIADVLGFFLTENPSFGPAQNPRERKITYRQDRSYHLLEKVGHLSFRGVIIH